MNNASFYLLTDAHYVSPLNWEEGMPITLRERGDQIALKATPQILDTFIEKILADPDTDTVVFTGDNVNSGDVNSHAGKKVYVTCATHDYCSTGEDECCFHGADRYTKTGTEPIPFMRRAELQAFYQDFGPKQALSVDPESGSYVVALNETVRLIMIVDNGNGRSHCGLFEEGFQWLRDQIREAKSAGAYVLLAVHHPVLPPWEVFRHMADFELFGGYRDLMDLMCREKIRVVFTGHTHVQSIRKYTDAQGAWFLNVATIALANAAGKMRKVSVNCAAGECDVQSVGIEKLQGLDTGGLSAYDYLYPINFPGICERLLSLGAADYDAFLSLGTGLLPVPKLRSHKKTVSALCRKALRMRLSTAAKYGRIWNGLSAEEKSNAKEKRLAPVFFEILRHIYTGNAPFTPDTLEYRSIMACAARLDRMVRLLRVKKVLDLIPPGSSLNEMAEDFLYNNRTGDDDSIRFSLK